MTNLTAMELAGNYPDNILITSVANEEGKFACFCYMTKDGDIHKLMLSSNHIFDTAEDAEQSLHTTAEQCIQHFKKETI